jgi:hypothetical protein
VRRAERTVGEQLLGDAVEDLVPLGVDRGEVRLGVEDVLDDDVAFLREVRARVSGRERYRKSLSDSMLASVPAILLGRGTLW